PLVAPVGAMTPAPAASYQPISATQLGHQVVGSGCDCENNACDGGCDSGRSCKISKRFDRCQSNWATAEALLWFPQSRNSPILAARAPGQNAFLANGTTPPPETLFGNDIDGGLAAGFRVDAGRWLIQDALGVGGRFWFLPGSGEDFSRTSDGTTETFGRPYFDSAANLETSKLTGFDNPGAGLGATSNITGTLTIDNDFEAYGAELYLKKAFVRTSGASVDLIGGFSHFSVNDGLSFVDETFTLPAGRTDIFYDDFNTENEFYGGQVGISSTIRRNRLTLTSVFKTHMGNMNMRSIIDGRVEESFAGVAGTTTFDNSFYSSGREGVYEDDTFTFIPELNLKLGVQIRRHVNFHVGYSLILFNDVALAGEQINPVLNGGAFKTNGAVTGQPIYQMQTGSTLLHGLDLGMTLTF
ncbi:MAG: BBP7 family outer membrane beta-barrel protein, partial [Planctomycetota bacterium]